MWAFPNAPGRIVQRKWIDSGRSARRQTDETEVRQKCQNKAIFEDVLNVLSSWHQKLRNRCLPVSLSRSGHWTATFPGEPGKTLSYAALISGATATVTLDTSAVRPARSYTLCARSSVGSTESHRSNGWLELDDLSLSGHCSIIEACSNLFSWNHSLMATQNWSSNYYT